LNATKMKHNTPYTRRRFLSTTAAAAGSILLPRPRGLAAADGLGQTDHFLYRLSPPDGPYIDTQRGNRAFAIGNGQVLFSEDNAKTWAGRADFADSENIMFSSILGNGNIVFATLTKIYLSNDNLRTYREIIVRDRDGSVYLPHAPSDPNKPGSYFYSLDGVHTCDVDGEEMLIWGNYCNVRHGAAPSNIYYSIDQGETVKIAYSFGQNPSFQQEGATPASYLGDPDNPVLCRHVHSVAYNPVEKAFYACTGDLDRR
jgi:hypothetical protein